MFSHVTVGTNDVAKAKAFYDGVGKALGLERLADYPESPRAHADHLHVVVALQRGHHLVASALGFRSLTGDGVGRVQKERGHEVRRPHLEQRMRVADRFFGAASKEGRPDRLHARERVQRKPLHCFLTVALM